MCCKKWTDIYVDFTIINSTMNSKLPYLNDTYMMSMTKIIVREIVVSKKRNIGKNI